MNTSVYQFTVELVVKLHEGSVSFIKVCVVCKGEWPFKT